jgi:hypothetical protein
MEGATPGVPWWDRESTRGGMPATLCQEANHPRLAGLSGAEIFGVVCVFDPDFSD